MKTRLLLGLVVALLTFGAAGGDAYADSSTNHRGLGKVTEVRGHTLTVVNRRGTFEILTDKDTIFRIRGVEDPSIKDVQVGDLVAGQVVRQKDGTLLAKVVAVIPPRVQRLRGLGKVTEVRGHTLTVVNRRGTFEILTDKDTIFRIRGVEDPSIKDVQVGDLVAGQVVRQKDGTLLAEVVAVICPGR